MNIEKTILEKTAYVSGYQEKTDRYQLSASMVGNDALQNYLSIVHGKVPDKSVTDATLGTIMHLGMETLMQDVKGVKTEVSRHRELGDSWVITGTADLVLDKGDYEEIYDYKFIKKYALEMIHKEGRNHRYALQLAVLAWLSDKEVRPYIAAFVKDAQALKNEPVFNLIPVDIYSKEEVEEMLKTETGKLEHYLRNQEMPPKCEDTWKRKVKGMGLIEMRCALYCSYGKAGFCPYYKQDSRQELKKKLSIQW